MLIPTIFKTVVPKFFKNYEKQSSLNFIFSNLLKLFLGSKWPMFILATKIGTKGVRCLIQCISVKAD